jgi:poly(3-hydroxyalkanoate) synthetase
VRGLEHLVADLQRGRGRLSIAMTDEQAFRLGENVAATPGKVVFQNDLMQLIQYAPTTAEVQRRPLLIIPPWINKFYIPALKPQNSFIKWAVDQGHTLFVISWVNPDERLAHKSFDDYMLEGPLAALDAIERATGEREANVIGYCIGGTCRLRSPDGEGRPPRGQRHLLHRPHRFRRRRRAKVFIEDSQACSARMSPRRAISRAATWRRCSTCCQ